MHHVAGALHSVWRPLQSLIMGAPAKAPPPAAAASTPAQAAAAAAVHPPPELSESSSGTADSLDDEVLLTRYELDRIIGRGGYSVVWRGTERASGAGVAIKRVVDAFRNEDDAKRTYREVALRRACRCEQILPLLAVLRASNGRDLYLVSPCMEIDLGVAMRSERLASLAAQAAACARPTVLLVLVGPVVVPVDPIKNY